MAWKFGISTIDYPYIDQNPKMKILKIFFQNFCTTWNHRELPTHTILFQHQHFHSPRKWNIHTLSSTHCVAEVFPETPKVEVLKRLREQWKAMEVFMSQFHATLFSGTYRWVIQFILGSFYSWGVNILSHVESYCLG